MSGTDKEYPAPWTLEIDHEHGGHQLRDANGESIGCFDEEDDGLKARAAGHICAAAPDLLEALEGISTVLRSDCGIEPSIQSHAPAERYLALAIRAIHKAYGDPA